MTAPHSSQDAAMTKTRMPKGAAEYASPSATVLVPCFDMESSSLISGQTAVFDMSGIRYILITPPWKIKDEEKESNKIPLRPLAEGGQGITYLTTNPNVILKFAKKEGKLIPASSDCADSSGVGEASATDRSSIGSVVRNTSETTAPRCSG